MAALINDGLPFRSRDSARVGLTRQQLRAAVARGSLRRVLRGVVIDASAADTLDVRARAVSLLVPTGVAIARSTAAWLYGVPPVEPGRHRDDPALELMSPRGVTGSRRSGVRGSSVLLDQRDVCHVSGLLVTTPARTMLDLVRDRDRPDALAYADALLRTGLVVLDDVQSGLARAAGHRWVEQAREMVELADPLAESPGESWMRLRYHDAGFPTPRVQLWVCEGATRYRLDLAREDEKAGFEYDGEAYHQSDQRAHDERRHAWFEARGWRVLNFGRAEVLGRGHAFEHAVADVLGVEPRLLSPEARRRTWAGRRRPLGLTTTA